MGPLLLFGLAVATASAAAEVEPAAHVLLDPPAPPRYPAPPSKPYGEVDDRLILGSQVVGGSLGFLLGGGVGALAVTNSGLFKFRICLTEDGKGCDTTAGDRARDILAISLMLAPGVLASSAAVYFSEAVKGYEPVPFWLPTLIGAGGCLVGTLASALLWDKAGVHEPDLVLALILVSTVAAEIISTRLLRP